MSVLHFWLRRARCEGVIKLVLSQRCGNLMACTCRELLHRYRSLITDNAQASTALLDTGASDPEGSFRSSMTQAERTMLQSAADPDHVTNVLRLLHERQQRRALHQELLKLRADQQEARVCVSLLSSGDHSHAQHSALDQSHVICLSSTALDPAAMGSSRRLSVADCRWH